MQEQRWKEPPKREAQTAQSQKREAQTGESQKREDPGARKGVALGDINLHIVWQAWHLRRSAGSGDALGWRGAASFCVAGVALGDMDFRSVWQAWHLATSTFTLCGRRGTYSTQPGLVTRLVGAAAASFCVAGVALGDMDLRFVWQAWHLATSTFTLCGRRGTDGAQLGLVTRLVGAAAASFCVAGVAVGVTELRFVWQAWH
eukprot:s2317_g2.t1